MINLEPIPECQTAALKLLGDFALTHRQLLKSGGGMISRQELYRFQGYVLDLAAVALKRNNNRSIEDDVVYRVQIMQMVGHILSALTHSVADPSSN